MAPSTRQAEAEAQARASPDNDVFRESLLRYVAFTSDLGEAFKPFISRRLYLGSYAVVALYGVLDTTDKGQRAYSRAATASQPLADRRSAAVSAIVASSIGAPPTSLPAPDLLPPLASLALQQSAALAHAAAVHCAACLPPPAAYHAPSISERQPLAVPVAAAVLDTALWHAAASLIIPGVAINRTVWATRHLLARNAWMHPRLRQLAPSAAGLSLLPLAVHHIDEAVTRWMDNYLRPHLPKAALPSST